MPCTNTFQYVTQRPPRKRGGEGGSDGRGSMGCSSIWETRGRLDCQAVRGDEVEERSYIGTESRRLGMTFSVDGAIGARRYLPGSGERKGYCVVEKLLAVFQFPSAPLPPVPLREEQTEGGIGVTSLVGVRSCTPFGVY